jgi:hypothetical protein
VIGGGVHNSERIRFGPDGALYTGTGDGGVGSRSQDPGSLNGRILRVPPGAFRGGPATPQQIALGLRHPQGLAWQPGTGRLWVTDHGPSGFDGPSGDDELDLIAQGGNYGWPLVRGTDHKAFAAPVHLWATTIAPASIAFVAQGGSTWTGRAIVTALRGEQLRLLTFKGDQVVADDPLLVGTYGRLRAIAEAPDGALWVGTSNRDALGTPGPDDDRILRIVPPAAPPSASPTPTPRPTAACPRVRRGPRGTGHPGPLARRLAKSQRVARLALSRLRAIQARLDGRRPPRACPHPARIIRPTLRQLVITRRIAVSALRLHGALAARLAGRRPPRPLPAPRLPAGASSRTPAIPRQVRDAERVAAAALRRAEALARAAR